MTATATATPRDVVPDPGSLDPVHVAVAVNVHDEVHDDVNVNVSSFTDL